MKLEELGVGRITAQNTTKDVKPGETQRQAAKLGFKLDSEGHPPELNKKARKNSDPNTLFNLGLTESYKDLTPEKMEQYIRFYADRHGVDPDVAIKVWKSEGGMNYQSGVKKGNQQKYKGAEDSWGPFQLYRGGGLGNEWEKVYGKNLRTANDPASIQQQIDFALQNAAKSGWGQWYGAAKVGVKDNDGIPDKPLSTKYKPIEILAAPSDSQVQQRIASKQPQPSTLDKISDRLSKAYDATKPQLAKAADAIGDVGADVAKGAVDIAKNVAKGNVNKDSWMYKNIVKPLTQDVNELKIEKPDVKDTLGIKRNDMPQVKSKDYPEFLDYMRDNGVTFKKEIISARDVKAMQDEFSDAGVVKQLKKNAELGPNTKPIILSSDNYIIDGHHRWLAAMNTGDDLNVLRVNMPAKQLYALVNKFEKVYYKDIYDETKGAISVPLSSGGAINIFPHRPLKIKPSTPGKLRYDETISQVDIAQLEKFADKIFAKVGIDVEFTRHFMDRVNDPRNSKPITPAELTRLFKQEQKRWGKQIAQMGPGSEAVMKDLQTDINLPFALQYDRENNELDLIAKTVMRKKDFKTSNKEFAVEGYQLKLENDEDQLILHIKDTKTGERSEVRGKSNYEIDYDANDPLHKLLDQIGRSANISELMNGKTVSINPKHPSGPQSIDTVKRIMDEDLGSLINFGGKAPGTKGFSQQKSNRGYEWIPGSNGARSKHTGTNYKLRPGQKKPNMLQRAWSSLVDDIELEEGVNDPHIFKAIFMAGGPGSGKGFVAKNILGGTGLRVVNSDDMFEYLMKQKDLALEPDVIATPQGQEIRQRAKRIIKSREATYIDGRIGLIIDGTGKEPALIQRHVDRLKELGYDSAMIMVNTSLPVAQQRNQERERTVPTQLVSDMWNKVQENLMKYQQIFGADRFHIIDNSGGLEDLDRQKNFDKVYNETQRFLNTPPSKPAAKKWIQQQKEQNDGQRSAQQQKPQQPSKKSDGGTTETN